jgi:hypothetical protein
MKILYGVPIALLLLCALSLVHAQREGTGAQPKVTQTSNSKSRREIVQEEQLTRLLSKVGVGVDAGRAANDRQQTYREVKIRWTAATAEQTDTANASSAVEGKQALTLSSLILEEKTRPGTLPRQRSLELSSTQILIAAVDEKNQLRWWTIAPDPRIVRAETPTPAGDLRREDYQLPDPTLLVSFPDDPAIVSLRFYHPSWNGTEFDLQLLSATPVQ